MKPRRRLRLGLLAGALVLVAAGIVGATLAVADINCPTGANGLCEGGSGDNHFNGTDNHDYIVGHSGNDRWQAAGGPDTVDAGANGDSGWGGPGDDTINGMDGNDDFGEGYDYLSGGDGSDEIHGGVGHDWLLGGDAHDSLHGKEGDDAIWAVSLSGDRDGSDYLNGGADTNHCAWDSTDTEQFCHPFN